MSPLSSGGTNAPPDTGPKTAGTDREHGRAPSGAQGAEGDGPGTTAANAPWNVGAWTLNGPQFNLYGQQEAPASPWEDELLAVPRLPEPALALDKEEVERRVDALQASRLLLLRHSPDRQRDAEAGMRGVLHALRHREAGRNAFTNGFDGTIRLHRMARGGWREDRRGTVIYLYGSEDPAIPSFFSSIEQVDTLCRQLAQMDCYLLLTASPTVALRCEHELEGHIGLWSFEARQPAGSKEFGQVFCGRFELTLAICAALFPGLPAGEFASLVKLLAPPTGVRSPPAATLAGAGAVPPAVAPPTREERWWQGERDLVLAELGLRLQLPPQAGDTGNEAADAGIFVADAARRAEIPTWLYEWFPLLLTEHLDALTACYLAPQASRRFGVGYRRLVQQLDASGLYPLRAAWLLQQTQAALDGAAPYEAMPRIEELVTVLPEQRDGERLIGDYLAGLARMVVAEESRLHEHLRERGLPHAANEQWPPPSSDFWGGLHETQAGHAPIEEAAQRHAMLVNLILALTLCAPKAVVKALGEALNQSDAALLRWLHPAGEGDPRRSLPSLAHDMFDLCLAFLLKRDPAQWMALAAAVGQVHPAPAQAIRPPPSAQPVSEAERQSRVTGRWLAGDCLNAVDALLSDLPGSPWPDPIYDALLGNDSGQRLGKVLAPLLLATAYAPDAEPVVGAPRILRMYEWLALAAAIHQPGDPEHIDQVGSALIAPLHAAFTQAWRIALVDLAANWLAWESDARAGAGTRDEREQATRRIKSLQLVVRKLRAAAPKQPSR